MSNKRPLILWSGGLDSSWLVYQELLKGDVDYISINAGQDGNKRRAEFRAREAMKAWFATQKLGSLRELSYPEFELNMTATKHLTWSQTIPWLVAAVQVVDVERHSKVMMGYVLGDEVISVLDQFQLAWDGMQGVCKHSKVPLEFPLTMISKFRILSQIPRGLYQHVWYCELPIREDVDDFPQYTPCNACIACYTHKTELYRYALRNPVPEGEQPRAIGTWDLHCPDDAPAPPTPFEEKETCVG